MSIFETVMLICFGAAWPVSIYRSYVSRTTGGKSVVFLIIVEIGYIAGILNKIINDLDLVIYLYVLNAIMVFADILLFYRNLNIEKQNDNND